MSKDEAEAREGGSVTQPLSAQPQSSWLNLLHFIPSCRAFAAQAYASLHTPIGSASTPSLIAATGMLLHPAGLP
jgi:hypothetical protein